MRHLGRWEGGEGADFGEKKQQKNNNAGTPLPCARACTEYVRALHAPGAPTEAQNQEGYGQGQDCGSKLSHTYCGWLRNPLAPRNETMVETNTFVGIYVGESCHSLGCLSWCEKRVSLGWAWTAFRGLPGDQGADQSGHEAGAPCLFSLGLRARSMAL